MDQINLAKENILTKFKKLRLQVMLMFIILILLGTGTFFGYHKWLISRTIIPLNIQRQLTFSVFWPNNNSPVKANKNDLKYDPVAGLLSYTENTKNISIVVSEQATPEAFTASQQVYNVFIQHLNQYETFNNSIGTVYLTHPKELNGGQTGIINTQGTLMFIKPSENLSDTTWRQIFNDLKTID
jgi:hypothetical protein